MKAFIHLTYMNKGFLIAVCLSIGSIIGLSCKNRSAEPHITGNTMPGTLVISYEDFKKAINVKRLAYKKLSAAGFNKRVLQDSITDFWVNTIGTGLFSYWEGTGWNFNGTTQIPKQGSIACGYLVTTLLTDMHVKLNRVKLAQYASSQMMKALTPGQPIKKYDHLSFDMFVKSVNQLKKGIYIIGLDIHTGFIIHDGTAAYFLHSYYHKNIGVIKEPVATSNALKQSVTKWMISLTGDTIFIENWLKE